MKLSRSKQAIIPFLAIIVAFSTLFFVACEQSGTSGKGNKVTEFYDTVVETQGYLDEVADDIYRYWYDAIYKDKYSGDINLAIAFALNDNSENLSLIEENDVKIKSLYKTVRDTDLSSEIKAVMSAYSDYYEFVVNVSGSFKSYSANKETLKKELASALKNLAMEI